MKVSRLVVCFYFDILKTVRFNNAQRYILLIYIDIDIDQ